jgi:hypothetical protein
MYRRDEGRPYLFHYTEAEDAVAIAADGYFQVGSGANFGLGLYATDLSPEEADPEEIQAVCFEGDALGKAFDGFLVLRRDYPPAQFIEVDRRVFLLPAREGLGETISLQGLMVSTGSRVGNRWREEPWD